jgi:hypothetical protein
VNNRTRLVLSSAFGILFAILVVLGIQYYATAGTKTLNGLVLQIFQLLSSKRTQNQSDMTNTVNNDYMVSIQNQNIDSNSSSAAREVDHVSDLTAIFKQANGSVVQITSKVSSDSKHNNQW